MDRIALVTGANRGIGQEIARELASKGLQVIMGMRDAKKTDIAKFGTKASALQIDVSDPSSILRAAESLAKTVGRLDVLINNAGILEDGEQSILEVDADTVERTFRTNALGALLVTQALWPLLLKGKDARVINMSSGAGQLNDMEGWAPAYSISKTALNAVTRQLAAAGKSANIAVNSVCPGWVRTDMGGGGAPRSVEQGADTPVWLATEAPQSLTGQFFRDRKPIPW